ncbi:Mitochondrial ATPase complex subunit atp10 [Blastocladiella emersonii ATCC 22665]|nr:Mitochondrial ATPase complex subunit atp10 [Blastocladiella emersonii ATCC 22665]
MYSVLRASPTCGNGLSRVVRHGAVVSRRTLATGEPPKPETKAADPAPAPTSPPTATETTPAAPAAPEKPKSLGRRIFSSLFDVFSKEKRLANRPALQKEYRESYWKDLQELNKTKGKLYIASDKLTKPQSAVRFPSLMVNPLDAPNTKIDLLSRIQGQVTLVTFAFNTYGDKHTKTFELPFRTGYPNVPVAQVSLADTPAKSWILKMHVPYTARVVAKPLHPWYFVSMFESLDAPLDHLAVTNRYLGWVFLVDANGRIRWRAHGMATPEELAALGRGTQMLLNEQEEMKHRK